ncbi:MAG TPA: SGNH/GDSL hydrolase family protein [Candidatus Scybalocola faecavium]|nr:SGNH/GDSL hydrolase family protein [Candidatus Scybalocola faecavium]
MIYQIKKNYPNGKIVCGTLMRTFIPTNDSWVFPEYFGDVSFEDYNDAIREASRRQKCCLADTDALNMRYETLDGSHPTVAGHRTLADAWRRCLVSIGLV